MRITVLGAGEQRADTSAEPASGTGPALDLDA